jgi:hypothetical protein
VVFSRGFDYWESGMDLHPSEDMYESFRKYQTSLLEQFDVLGEEYGFEAVDASSDVRTVFEHLRDGIGRVLSGEPREPLFAVQRPKQDAEAPAESNVVELPAAGKIVAAGTEN